MGGHLKVGNELDSAYQIGGDVKSIEQTTPQNKTETNLKRVIFEEAISKGEKEEPAVATVPTETEPVIPSIDEEALNAEILVEVNVLEGTKPIQNVTQLNDEERIVEEVSYEDGIESKTESEKLSTASSFETPDDKITREKEYLMKYFNVDSIAEVDTFLKEFVKTMAGYGATYTLDDIVDIFFETATVPLEDKIEFVKSDKNLTDSQLDEVMATLVCEGQGGGNKYVDVFAAATTALNHTQYQVWIDSIVRVRGEELGHTLYGHTCYVPQFQPYQSNVFYSFLGKRDIVGYYAALDVFYINSVYGLVMHNYTEFRGSWVDIDYKMQYVAGGNKFLHEMRPEDRIQNELTYKNNSTL